MKTHICKLSFAAVLIFVTSSLLSAQAEPASDLDAWKQEAAALISARMTFPRNPSARHNALHEANVLINRDGRILKKTKVYGAGTVAMKSVSRRTLRELTSLPRLPESFADEQAIVKIRMIYATDDASLKALEKRIKRRSKSVRIDDLAARSVPRLTIAAN